MMKRRGTPSIAAAAAAAETAALEGAEGSSGSSVVSPDHSSHHPSSRGSTSQSEDESDKEHKDAKRSSFSAASLHDRLLLRLAHKAQPHHPSSSSSPSAAALNLTHHNAHVSGPTKRRVNAGHVVSFFILLGGVAFILLAQTLRLYSDSLSDKERSPGGFCCMPPKSQPTEEEVMGDFKRYPRFDVSIPIVAEYAKLVHSYLEPWHPIQGIDVGLGSGGFVTAESLDDVATNPTFMSCNGQIRVVNGHVYLRYGGFWNIDYRLHRFLQTAKMVQDAVEQFELKDVNVEFFVNTCDLPMAFYSAFWAHRAGYPIMSTTFTADTMDIPIPDPLDLNPSYMPDLSTQTPWERKQARAVFRGKSTNFPMYDGNWAASPRVRLHITSGVRELEPLMDARISGWSTSTATKEVIQQLAADGVVKAPMMNFTQFNALKYQIIVDGGGGSSRTCGVLRSNQMSIRQYAPMLQFYEPLLKHGTHWLSTSRTFTDLPERVKWAMENDEEALRMVLNANGMARHACTWRGRTLYWAVLLLKYHRAMQAPDRVEAPRTVCEKPPLLELLAYKGPDPTKVRCDDPQVAEKQPNCIFFCSTNRIPKDQFVWLHASALNPLKRVSPP